MHPCSSSKNLLFFCIIVSVSAKSQVEQQNSNQTTIGPDPFCLLFGAHVDNSFRLKGVQSDEVKREHQSIMIFFLNASWMLPCSSSKNLFLLVLVSAGVCRWLNGIPKTKSKGRRSGAVWFRFWCSQVKKCLI